MEQQVQMTFEEKLQKLAELAEEVVEVVYGIPVWHKGGKEA